jgi:hypothetical protein
VRGIRKDIFPFDTLQLAAGRFIKLSVVDIKYQ